jgi:hypothetical protein
MHLTPHDLLAAGFADALAPHDPVPLRAWLAATLDALGSEDQAERLERRAARWAGALRGRQPQIGRNRPHGEPGVR